ncbi:Hypothetical predicted protein [Cloeon dipterum]|uniref:Uncharacterized protein n=1 Tax=Cloeon dipterum TaxID=197152 RepID=A0A8S1CYK6_9INSE|nr:Hypothetical predicted protein [Cloeon dipterum]
MRFFSAALVALVAVTTVSTLRQYPRQNADNYERYKNSDLQLEPPRPEEFEFFKSASEPKSFRDEVTDDFHFARDEDGKKNKAKVGGKTQYHSNAKPIPEVKPIFAATEDVEKSDEQVDESEEQIRCVKVDTKPVTADDVYKGRFRRAASDKKTMTCFKCEDLKKGGFYQKCSYGTDPKNKAFFISHEKASSSNEKPKFHTFGPEWDEEGEEPEESKIERQIKESFYSPSSEYLKAAESIGKYVYDGPDFSSSNTNYRYEVPDSSYDKSRIPKNHPSSDHYQPSPSYLKAMKQSPDDDNKKTAKPTEGVEYVGKPTEHRYSSYGEKESSQGKKGSSEEEGSSEDGYKGHPSEQSYDSRKGSSEEGSGEEGSDEYSGKPTEYHFKSSKKEPTKTYSSYTTDPPVNYYYETKEASPSQKKTDYASTPNDYVYSTKKKHPTKLYSYETTDKPVSYEYKTESKTEPKAIHQPAYEYYSPTEFTYSKTVDDPLKTYYQSSSYGDEEDKPAEGNAPKEQTVEAPKGKKKKANGKKGKHAPQVTEVSEYSTTADLPDTFVAQPSEELRKAMGQFLQADRTNCTQVQREKMVCWDCIDAAGTKQEECMYVASSQPAAYQTAYSDRKENVQKPGKKGRKQQQQPAEQKNEESVAVDQKQEAPVPSQERQQRRRPASNRKHHISAVTTTESRTRKGRPVAAATSTTAETRVAVDKDESRRRRRQPKKVTVDEDAEEGKQRRRRRPKQEPRRAAAEPKKAATEQHEQRAEKAEPPPPPTPKEFEVADEEGAFSAETRVKYNKRLGMSLPEYMLTKSDFEAEFDRAVQAG